MKAVNKNDYSRYEEVHVSVIDPNNELPPIKVEKKFENNKEAIRLIIKNTKKLEEVSVEKEIVILDDEDFKVPKKRRRSSAKKEAEKRRKENTPEKIAEKQTRILSKV